MTKHLLNAGTDAIVDVANESIRLFGEWNTPLARMPEQTPPALPANPFNTGGRSRPRLPWLNKGE